MSAPLPTTTGHLHVRPLAHDHRTLAPELQRDRDQVLRRGAHDMARHRGATREYEVIEREARERSPHLGAPREHGHLRLVECLSNDVTHELRTGWRHLGGLDERSIACREDPRERTERQVEGEVPGAHDAHDAEWLVAHLGRGAQEPERERGRAFLRLHPAPEALLAILGALDDGCDLGPARAVPAPMPEIRDARVQDPGLVLDEARDESVQTPHALLRGRRSHFQERGALPLDDLLHPARGGSDLAIQGEHGCSHDVPPTCRSAPPPTGGRRYNTDPPDALARPGGRPGRRSGSARGPPRNDYLFGCGVIRR
jgi:hypothetical protein